MIIPNINSHAELYMEILKTMKAAVEAQYENKIYTHGEVINMTNAIYSKIADSIKVDSVPITIGGSIKIATAPAPLTSKAENEYEV